MKNAVPFHVAVLVLLMVRVSRNGSPEIVIPPFAFVTPPPLSVPPDHVIPPVTVNVSLPVSVPVLWVTEFVVIAFPVEKVNVPPLSARAPVLVTVAGDVKFAAPEDVVCVPPVTL